MESVTDEQVGGKQAAVRTAEKKFVTITKWAYKYKAGKQCVK